MALDRQVAQLPSRGMWITGNHGADALYVSLERPQPATNGIMRDDGILLRYRGKKPVGSTVLKASNR